MDELDLSGQWQAATAEMTTGSVAFHGSEFDDTNWLTIDVPSHWARYKELSGGGNTVLYRRRFETSVISGERSWLQFDGVFTHANVWVDGSYVGELDGYFARHAFDITKALIARSQHVVAVEVNAPLFDMPWPSPGGIWQPVHIYRTGAVGITRTRVLCSEARDERGVLTCYLELDALNECEVKVRTAVTSENDRAYGAEHEMRYRLATGANRISWQIAMDQPELWWPFGLGDQAFVDVLIEVTDISKPDEVSAKKSLRTAFRHASYDNGFTYINGERLFLQSIESGNDGTPPLETDYKYFDELLRSRRDAGANMVVRSKWIEPQPFYNAADDLGMLIWQGVPVIDNRPPRERHGRQMIEVLGHHPSIALWIQPSKRLRDRRPAPDSFKKLLNKADGTRANIQQPLGWNLNRLNRNDILAIVPKWTKRSHFLHFTSDPREASGQIEALRLLKYRPLGGFIGPLALPELLNGACDPIRLVALSREELIADNKSCIEIFILNETREGIFDAIVSAQSNDEEWQWQGNVGPDAVSFVGTIQAIPTQSGFDLTLGLYGSNGNRLIGEHHVQFPVKRS